jgi:RimK family alpha-L-glutamate ligase
MEDYLDYKIAILSHLEKMGVFILNNAKSMRTCIDKLQSQIIFANMNVKTPKTAMLTSDTQIDFVAKYFDEKFPLIVKTLFGSGGIGVAIVDSFASFKSVAQVLLDKQIPFLIQEYIEHDSSYRIITLGDKVLASNVRKKKEGKDFRTNSHQGSDTEKYDPPEKEIELAFSLAKAVGATFAALDYIVKDDEVYVLEINGSPGLENIQKNWPDKDLAMSVIKYCQESFESKDHDERSEHTTDASKSAADDTENTTVDTGVVDLKDPSSDPVVISTVEPIIIKRINDNEPIQSRVDTGAAYCSLSGSNVEDGDEYIKFSYGEVRYRVPVHKTIKIRTADGGSVERHVVRFNVSFKGNDYNDVEFTIADRSEMKYDVLIGRNLLEMTDALIKV